MQKHGYICTNEEYDKFVENVWFGCKPLSDTDQEMTQAAMELACEATEVLDVFKKGNRIGKEVNKEKLTDEIGDVIWALTNLARLVESKYDITFDECVEANTAKITDRNKSGTLLSR